MKRAVATEPAPLTCECCGEESSQLIPRHGTSGLNCCFGCLQLKPHELAVKYGARLRKAAERAR